MEGKVYTKSYDPPAYDRKEILRYAGVRAPGEEIGKLMESCLEELAGRISCKVCYAEFPVRVEDGELDLGFAKVRSADLRKNLAGCESIVLFAATVGLEIDRLIARYARLEPSRAFLFQAIGAERIESLCNLFNREVNAEKGKLGSGTRPRFSPGYGDLELTVQRDIFRVLDCPRKIGLTLNETCLMSPTKSVTALIGVYRI